jgi:hypothetical protein
VDEIGPHMIQFESIPLGQTDIGKSYTRIRQTPLHVDLAIISHQSCGIDIHALVAHPNGDPHRALTANRCFRLAMSTPYSYPTN